jgi:hypothetical protein
MSTFWVVAPWPSPLGAAEVTVGADAVTRRQPVHEVEPKSTGLVTMTSLLPGAARPRSTVALMLEEETNWTGLATMSGWPERRSKTVGVSAKLEPEMVSTVEPVLAATVGLMLLTDGPGATVKQPLQVAVPWSVFVRMRSRAPIAAVELTVTSMVNVDVSVTTTFATVTPVPETTTLTPVTKSDPCRVTEWLAPCPSVSGVADVAKGLAFIVKQLLQDPDPKSGFVTFSV